jgi:hypothetical protein
MAQAKEVKIGANEQVIGVKQRRIGAKERLGREDVDAPANRFAKSKAGAGPLAQLGRGCR